MRRIRALLCVAVVAVSAFAGERVKGAVSLDISYGLSFGVYSGDSTFAGEVEKWVKTVLSLRGGPLVNVTFPITDRFNLGVETGIQSMALEATFKSDSTDSLADPDFAVKFRDFPLRVTTTFRTERFLIRPYAGLLLRYGGGDLVEEYKGLAPCFELGARGGVKKKLGLLRYVPYADLSMVMGERPEFRAGVGLLVHILH